MFNCSCCGTEVTSPYFFEGGVYGYTCIKKVKPNTKKNKPKQKCLKVDVVSCDFEEGRTRTYAKVVVGGVRKTIIAFREYNCDTGVFSNSIELQGCEAYNGQWWAFA